MKVLTKNRQLKQKLSTGRQQIKLASSAKVLSCDQSFSSFFGGCAQFKRDKANFNHDSVTEFSLDHDDDSAKFPPAQLASRCT